MGHLLIITCKKVHYNQSTFTDLEFSNFAIHVFDKKICLNIFGMVKIVKAPVRFEFVNYRFVVVVLAHCATQLGNNFGKEEDLKLLLIILFILIESKAQYGDIPDHLNSQLCLLQFIARKIIQTVLFNN